MIDTDKYEGHNESIKRWQMFSHALTIWADEADKKLIADAPLLLQEVKRLREGIEHALHIRLRHGQEEGWKELKELIE